MIASWMLYALLVSVLTGTAAWLLEEVYRLRGHAVRFLWLGALVGTVALVAAAPLRSTPPVMIVGGAANARPAMSQPERRADAGVAALASRALGAARNAVMRPLRAAAALGGGATGTALGAAWLALSAALLTAAAATLLRARRTRRGWPLEVMAGAAVRVAPGVGPAVLGIRHPEVVVPAWLLEAPPEEQAMVVAHEREHIRAHDPLVLALGSLAAALMPWNPAAWWMLLRLRTAVELDCDARVLRRGVRPQAYGTLLIDMAGRGPGLSLGAPALAGWPSTLERRLRAMNARLPRFARLRAGGLAMLGVAMLAGACDTPLPTSAEVEKMDVAAAETRASALDLNTDNTTYIVDGKVVTREQAHELIGDRIVSLQMTRNGATGGTINITTAPGVVVRAGESAERSGRPTTTFSIRAGASERPHTVTSGQFEGLVVIDGVVSTSQALHRLDPSGIEGIEVIKGAAATRLYDDPRAAHGVIHVTTKARQ